MVFRSFRLTLVLLLGVTTLARAQAPLAPVEAEIAAAERALSTDERQLAESHYHGALYAGWMLMGALASADRRFVDARDAFTHASASVVDGADALTSLAMVHLQLNDAASAIPILTRLTAASPKQMPLKRLLAQALVAANQSGEAVQILEEAHGAAPEDLETSFALATGYLRLKKTDAAKKLFAQLAAARAIPETYVLIGRAYRDAGMYEDARAALNRALTMNPRVRHANYYLGTAAVMQEGVVRLEEAIAAFRRELKIAPGDPAASRLLGIALVEAHQEREALPLLEDAARVPGATWQTWQYLGRAQLGAQQTRESVASFRTAIELASATPSDAGAGGLHYQLAQALRQNGDADAAAAEFATASAAAQTRADSDRDNLQRFLTDDRERPGAEVAQQFALDAGPLSKVSAQARAALQSETATALARVYLNLGIMQAQANRFARAVESLQAGAALAPDLPQLQYSLGVAAFSARHYAVAAEALERAVAADAANADARRMLALASLNSEHFARAAELLRDDPEARRDPSLQYAYGVALVHSGHATEAEQLFSTLLASHADNPELNVLLGEAHAEQGDYDGAVASLRRALTLKPGVPDANRTLGFIYMKQGKLAEAAASLQAELATHPDDLRARYTLATVFDLDNKQPQALEELARVLQARPNDPDARYLTGKILLARGSAAEAAEHLEIAARLAVADANVQYQLGQAYQKLGRTADAQKAFERFQQLKDQRRGGGQ